MQDNLAITQLEAGESITGGSDLRCPVLFEELVVSLDEGDIAIVLEYFRKACIQFRLRGFLHAEQL